MNIYVYLFIFPKIIFFISIIKFCKPCPKSTPFLKEGICILNCMVEEINNGSCLIENEIVKTQWITNIEYISENGYNYFNMATTQNGDLLILMSSYPATKTRILYGLTSEGRGYFSDNKNYTMQLSYREIVGKFESEIFMIKLSSLTSTTEYIFSFGKTPQFIEVYDLNAKKIYYSPVTTWFYDLYDVHQIVGGYLKLTTNDYNYYLLGLLAVQYNNGKGTPILVLIKFRIKSFGTNLGTINKEYISSDPINVYESNIVSCYEISTTKSIICFYKSTSNKYLMRAFDENLKPKQYSELGAGDKNSFKFFKCCHFYGDIGAFLYYSNDRQPKAIIEFRQYIKSTNKINNVFNKITFNDYSFHYNCTLNDIIKAFDKKIYFGVVSLDQLKVYITSIYNYDGSKIIHRIYEINSFVYKQFYFYNTLRLQIYNNYLAMGSNGFTIKSESFTALNIFSYPNSIDIDNDLTEYLLKHNEIKIKNIILEVKNICKLENNIFGHILTGMTILDIEKNSNEYLSLEDGREIEKNMFLTIDKTLKLEISKTGNYFKEFNYGMKYVCEATEPEYEKYNIYPIYTKDTGTSNKEDTFWESRKKTYTGRHSFYYFLLDNKLTEVGCDELCELCKYSNKNICITCNYDDFDFSGGIKTCKEPIFSTMKETAIPEKIETTIPEIIETSIPEKIETTIPEKIETTIPEKIETTIPEIIETTIPEIIETIIPEKIETSIPEIIETNSPEKMETTLHEILESAVPEKIENFVSSKLTNFVISKCTAKYIIEGVCKGELTDEMADEIYAYVKTNLINSNYTEENTLIKTPSVAFQLTSLDYQKNNNLNLSIVDLGQCEIKLKKHYTISEEDDLIIFKIDIQDSDKSLTYVQYEIYHPFTLEQLDLTVCQNEIINITIPANLDSETINIYQNLQNSGYNLFNSNDKFYNDICSKYSSINNTDILLIDRKTDFYDKYANITICQKNCNLQSYHDNSKSVSCFCYAQSNDTDMDLNIQPNFYFNGMKNIFLNYLNNSNFRVIKCYKIAIDFTSIFENIGRIIMSIIVFAFIILFIIFLIKGNKQLSLYIKGILNAKLRNKKEKNNLKNESNKKLVNKIKIKMNKPNNKSNYKSSKNKNKNNDSNKKKNIKNKKKSISNPIINKKIKINENNKTKSLRNLKIKKSKNSFTNNNSSSPSKNYLINQNNSSYKKLKNNLKLIKNNIVVYNIVNNFNNNNISKKETIKFKQNNEILKPIKYSLNDHELNTLEYNKAVIIDKRSYCQYYCSLLKKKHLILFAFLPVNDYNLQYIKIMLFLLSFSLYFCINGFFFSDETMHQIYINYGLINYLNQIVSIVYSSLIPAVINTILKLLSLSENDILRIKNHKGSKLIKTAKQIENCLKIKYIIFFIICYALLFFFWYFISCFCGVYKNTQIVLITDTFISFGLSLIYPFGLYLLPGIFRISALKSKKKDKKCLYKFSNLVALI